MEGIESPYVKEVTSYLGLDASAIKTGCIDDSIRSKHSIRSKLGEAEVMEIIAH
jgi:hypothetical protein